MHRSWSGHLWLAAPLAARAAPYRILDAAPLVACYTWLRFGSACLSEAIQVVVLLLATRAFFRAVSVTPVLLGGVLLGLRSLVVVHRRVPPTT